MCSFTVLDLSKRDHDQALAPGRGSLPPKVRQFAAPSVIVWPWTKAPCVVYWSARLASVSCHESSSAPKQSTIAMIHGLNVAASITSSCCK